MIALYEKLSKAEPQHDEQVLKLKITKNNESDRHYGDDGVFIKVPFLSVNQIATYQNYLVELKRKRTEVNDAILDRNVKTTISIDCDDYEFLQSLGIV